MKNESWSSTTTETFCARLISVRKFAATLLPDGAMYVLRGRENKDQPNKSEEWRIARLHLQTESPDVKDLAAIPFAARSLMFDGQKFWSNHRAANETMSFSLPT